MQIVMRSIVVPLLFHSPHPKMTDAEEMFFHDNIATHSEKHVLTANASSCCRPYQKRPKNHFYHSISLHLSSFVYIRFDRPYILHLYHICDKYLVKYKHYSGETMSLDIGKSNKLLSLIRSDTVLWIFDW